MEYFIAFMVASAGVLLWWNASMRKQFKDAVKGSTGIFVEQMHIHEDGYSPNRGIWIGVQDLRDSIPYWGECCLDASHQALSVLWAEKDMDFDQLKRFVEEYGEKVISFVWKHYDDEEGSFRNHVSAWPSLYATFSAIRMIKYIVGGQKAGSASELQQIKDRPLSKEELIAVIGRDRAQKILKFIRNCESESGGFSDAPYEKPTIASSDAAIIASWEIEEREEEEFYGTRDFVWNCAGEISPGKVAFRNSPGGGEYCSSFTRYAIRALDCMKALDEDSSDFDKVPKIILFLKDCEDPKTGGYSWRPGEPPSIVHTNLVFNAFRRLVLQKDFFHEDGIIKPDKLWSFIRAQIDRGLGYEKDAAPNIHVAANTALLAARLSGLYRHQVKSDEEIRSKLNATVLSFFDEKEGGFRGYNPLKF